MGNLRYQQPIMFPPPCFRRSASRPEGEDKWVYCEYIVVFKRAPSLLWTWHTVIHRNYGSATVATPIGHVRILHACNYAIWQTTHECTQFSTYPLVPIDTALDCTSIEVVPSICEAPMSVRLTSMRAASDSYPFIHFVQCMCQEVIVGLSMMP